MNDILNRISTFESSINALGTDIARTQLIGNDTINLIQSQIKAINKKGKLAAKYIDTSDERLETLFNEQVNMISKMNTKYRDALQSHMDDYEEQMKTFIEEMEVRRQLFLEAIREKITVEQVHDDFSNLAKLNDIEQKLNALESKVLSAQELHKELEAVNKLLEEVKKATQKIGTEGKDNKEKDKKEEKGKDEKPDKPGGGIFGGWFGGGRN